MRTNFYIDGFNLYYRALKDTSLRWLDLFKLCQSITPSHMVNHIRLLHRLGTPKARQSQLAAQTVDLH